MDGKLDFMNAAVMKEPGNIKLEKVEVPVIKSNQVKVKVHCIGVCGSDIHFYEYGRLGRYVVEDSLILGHELAGEVVEVGLDVKNVSVGQRVAVEPGVPCSKCEYCREGRYNLCPDVEFMATPPTDGAWAEYVAIDSEFVFPLPDNVTYEAGALIEPLAVGIHAMSRGNVGPSDRLIITGLGPIGLLAIEAAKMFGVTEIYGSDVIESRRQLALEMGAKGVIDPSKEDAQSKLTEIADGELPNVLIETSGNANSISSAFNLVKRGGRLVFVGMPMDNSIKMDVMHMVDSEFDVHGVFRYVNDYPTAIQGLSNPLVNVEKVITHHFKLEDIHEALDVAVNQKGDSIKIMIYP